jgi:signal transduction histidine kinase
MTLLRRALLTSAMIALPVAALAVVFVDRVRAGDLERALVRVVRSQVNDQVRERCESDPRWFLTGPLDGRPRGGDPISTDPDALPPRPRVAPQPFELFAYDEQFIASSSAAPRFPLDMRQRLQTGVPETVAPHEVDTGTGVQVAMPTGWIGSPCMYFLGRMEPPPDQASSRVWLFGLTFLAAFGITLAAALPLVSRIRRLSGLAQDAKTAGFTTVALDGRRDELNAVTFVYNDAVNELGLRKSRIEDLDGALRRFVQSTDDDVAAPLRALERTLALSVPHPDEPTALSQAHDLASRVENLTAAARLRMSGGLGEPARIDVTETIGRVVSRYEPLARVAHLTLSVSTPGEPIVVRGDEALLERLLANLVDNAVRHNVPDGSVTITLVRDGTDRFRIVVANTGPGLSAEDFKTLTAIRRFRGDEHRTRRPAAPGLGLSVAREIADRFGLQLELRRPASGGLEAEISGPAL